MVTSRATENGPAKDASRVADFAKTARRRHLKRQRYQAILRRAKRTKARSTDVPASNVEREQKVHLMARLNEPPLNAPAPSNQGAAGATAVGDGAVESIDTRESHPKLSIRVATDRRTTTRAPRDMRTKSLQPRTRPPADFQEVKRRFIRQNRDLAKCNSSQSLRIRSLEIEVSRLLQDNLDLRTRMIDLENELHEARRKTGGRAASEIKDELRSKLAELGVIIESIGNAVPAGAERKSYISDRPWPMETQWKERRPLAELMREVQMPTIAEGRSYPRRTLDAQEVLRLSNGSSNESPDLGPPPVARFDCSSSDPIKFDRPAPTGEMAQHTERDRPAEGGTEEPTSDPLVNLETRRKRRDGQTRLESRRSSILPPASPSRRQEELPPALRTGAKRKLADRDTDKPIKPPSKGDFTFSRKTVAEPSKQDAPIRAQTDVGGEQARPIALTSPKPVRKVLGEKSVNMSPRKAQTADKESKEDAKKAGVPGGNTGKERQSTRARRVASIPVRSPKHDIIIESTERAPRATEAGPIVSNPETPAPLTELASPMPSEPSATAVGRTGTPPPGDLSTLSSSSDVGAGRPSRRARAAVNYAEPSLISKMRRPDKKMVDAITGLQDPRRSMNASAEKKAAAPRSVSMTDGRRDGDDGDEGLDDGNDKQWRDPPGSSSIEPLSPLHNMGNPSAQQDLPQTASEEVGTIVPGRKAFSSASALSLLTAGSRGASTTTTTAWAQEADVDTTAKRLQELELYEFKESSPASTSSVEAPKREGIHRRHSSAPKQPEVVEDASLPPSADGTMGKMARASSRRRSMML